MNNLNSMYNNVKTSEPSGNLFSKSTSVTLSVTLMILGLTVLGRAVCAMIFSQKLSVLSSVYQIFGAGSEPIINIIFGSITCLILVFLAVGLFSARSGVNAEPPTGAGLRFLKAGLILALIYSALAVVVSFASVSVINYNDIEGYSGSINFSAAGLFWFTLFLGLSILCCEIGFLRFSGSLLTNVETGFLAKKGTALSFIMAILGALTSVIACCVKLFKLVSPPKEYIERISADKSVQGFENSEMILNSFNVIIFAALAVVFVCIAAMAGSYAMSADMIIRNARMSAYNYGHTVPDPEDIPDYSTPNNYNYNQSAGYVPYYKANQYYQDIYKNIYTGQVPPVPQAPENPFKPRTQYPAQTAAPADTEAPSDSSSSVKLDKD